MEVETVHRAVLRREHILRNLVPIHENLNSDLHKNNTVLYVQYCYNRVPKFQGGSRKRNLDR